MAQKFASHKDFLQISYMVNYHTELADRQTAASIVEIFMGIKNNNWDNVSPRWCLMLKSFAEFILVHSWL